MSVADLAELARCCRENRITYYQRDGLTLRLSYAPEFPVPDAKSVTPEPDAAPNMADLVLSPPTITQDE